MFYSLDVLAVWTHIKAYQAHKCLMRKHRMLNRLLHGGPRGVWNSATAASARSAQWGRGEPPTMQPIGPRLGGSCSIFLFCWRVGVAFNSSPVTPPWPLAHPRPMQERGSRSLPPFLSLSISLFISCFISSSLISHQSLGLVSNRKSDWHFQFLQSTDGCLFLFCF